MSAGFRLSPQQERVWTLQESATSPYEARCVARLAGPLDREALEAAFARLVKRYEILRTTFTRVSGLSLPLQSIGGETTFQLAMHDLAGVARDGQAAYLLERLEGSPFDLAAGPPLQAALGIAAPDEAILLLRLPALCADPASLLRLLSDLRAGYAAALGTGDPPAGEPVQFADLAEWQNELIESEEMEAGRTFWRRQELADLLAARLPFALPGRIAAGFAPRRCGAQIDSALGRRLASLADEREAPLASLLAAAWQVFLGRFSGCADLVVGTLFDGRSYEALEEAVGPLARILPQPVRIDGTLPFTAFWDRTRESAAELYGWQEYFSWQEMGLKGTAGRPPFCALGFELSEWPPAVEAAGLTFDVESLDACLDRFELKLAAARRADESLSLELHYDSGAYGETEVQGALASFRSFLAVVAERPTAPVDEIRLLDPEERRRLTLEIHSPGQPAGRDPLVHRELERWARSAPDSLAVVFGDVWLTFAELNARANQLARHLRTLGVEPEVPVALCLERSHEMIVSMLAVLKAGGAYLPLDPALPVERLRFMLVESGAPVVITVDRLAAALPAEGVSRVRLDVDGPEIASQEAGDLDAAAAAGNAAYILFTSGSTGQPKGVVVEHRQLASYVYGIRERLDLPPETTYATVSTFAADLGNTVIYASLCGGGCLHLIPQDLLLDPEGFAGYVERNPIDCLKIVPSHLEALLANAHPERTLPRRRLVLGGEASLWSWVEELRRLAPDCQILNHYGPTETTVGVLTYALDAGRDLPPGSNLPLGRPLAGSRVYVLDRYLEPVPEWVAGEIFIGGDNVTRGYLGRPDLTAERFIPDPFGDRPGERVYRTGDLGRILPGGDREFLGRIDDQVKIHGFRIEPGEIEAVLAGHPGVRECAVVAREDEPGQRRLVAYLVPRAEAPRVADLRELLSRRLPEFMMPAAFVAMVSLPLNANGKLDRRRLPAPDPAQARSEQDYVAPTTDVERLLAEIWEGVLGIDQVGIRDNFFHLGGDSIRSIEVRAQGRKRGLDFSIAEIFQHQTVEQLARHLEATSVGRSRETPDAPEYVPFSLVPVADVELLPTGVEDAYPLCMMQQGMLFHSLLSTDSATYHDVGSYRFQVPYDPQAFRRAAGTLVERHAALRTSFDLTSFGEPLQVVHRRAEVPVVADEWRVPAGSDPEAAWDTWIDEEVRTPFHWDRAPLFRIFLHRLGEDSCQITVSFHHSILDGWSRHSLVTELVREYLREMEWEIPPLPSLPQLSYGEFVGLEREALASDEHRSFWQRELADAVRTTFPRRPSPPSVGEGLQARLHVTFLPPDLCDGLHRLARASGVPIKSVLLAATLRMLGEHNGRPDAMNGLVVNGRPEKTDGDRASGLFLNTVPLRLRMEGGTWIELVRAAYETEAGLLPYRRFPMAELQRLFGGGEALFETTFNYMHYHVYRRILEVKGLEFLGYKGFEETNLTCVVNFHQDPVNNEIQLGIEYHASILHEEQIEKISAYLVATLGAMVRTPEGRYDLFSPLTGEERKQLLHDWNDTAVGSDLEVCLHELCARQAARTPNAVAVILGSESLTYAGLDERANRLAQDLRARGVGPEVPVAIFAERSLELIVALLAALKAGGAYVPLDPELPPARLALMLEDVAPPVVLTLARLAPALPPSSAQVLRIDADWETIAAHPATAPHSGAGPENAAYIIYTSGSTGQPKGAINSHRGIVNRLLWMQDAFGLTDADRVLQKTPYSFDVSVWELFWPLMTGAALVFAKPGGQRDGDYLLRLIDEERITTLHFVPSMLQVFLEQPGVESRCTGLRRVICSGEALTFELVRRFSERCEAELHNLYGPTEAAVDVTWWPCRPGEGIVPIGRPIANLRTYLVNPYFHPVPVSVPGELMIGGVGLARGYLRRPGLTAERFIPDPWSGKGGERLYRTGDLARFLPDGNIEFLGRIDHQVKIRGFRIELGEIEATLLGHCGVHECAVVAGGSGAEPVLVAYWTAAGEPVPNVAELRAALRAQLPEYMVPAHFVALAAMPLSPNGKLDRRALPAVDGAGIKREVSYLPPRNELERRIAAVWQEVLRVEQVGVLENFFDLGGHSLHLLRIHVKLREVLDRDLAMVDLFRFPSVQALAGHLSGGEMETVAPALGARRAELRGRLSREGRSAVAVIGMGCRFPGAASVEEFWGNLSQGRESIVPLSEEELLADGIEPSWIANPSYIKAKGVLAGTDLFDAAFFNFSPMDASILDPQQRLFLECSWEALEDAGYDSERYPGAGAVFGGVGMNTYAFNLYSNPALLQSIGGYQAMLANDKDFLATRVSYKLDLRGPSMTVQTACSTSLVAIHLACQSLLAGESDMALAGGVRVAVPQKAGYLYQEGGIHSPDGHVRAFDAQSGGIVGGDGVGVIVLKRLADALEDGDCIRAVIRGSAVNNDGAQRVGYTAPGVEGQARVIAEALAVAGVDARSVSYVEAHGTATELGDPVEIAGLTQAFRGSTADRRFCAIGSVKTNVGHLDAAAGVASVIKTVLALEREALPPSLHFERPNPRIDFDASPFYVNASLAPWPRGAEPRRAGVSSLGIGGTNAHLVIEEAPAAAPSGESRAFQLLLLAARTGTALDRATCDLADHLENHPEISLADAAYTLQAGRRPFGFRRSLVCRDREDAVAVLRAADPRRTFSASTAPGRRRSLAFLFPGQGAQHAGMAAGLYRSEPVFRREIDRCAELLAPHLGCDLRRLLDPPAAELEAAGEELLRTALAQPTLFAVEYALACLWRHWGIEPDALIGHSVGEYVAATLADVFSLEDAAGLVAARGSLMESLPEGAMVAISLSEADVEPWLGDGLSLAAVNGPSLSVLSGPVAAVEAVEGRLRAEGVECRRLHTSHAFHSAAMDPAVAPLVERVSRIALHPPRIPFLSNLTGTWIQDAEATDPAYWGRHLRQPVRFASALGALLEDPDRVLLEVGPGRSLATLAQRHPGKAGGHLVLSSMRHPDDPQPDLAFLLTTLGRLWLAGVGVSWQAFHSGEERRRIRLPTYPFERRRYWIDRPVKQGTAPLTPAAAGLERKADLADWFFAPRWHRSPLPSASLKPGERCLLLVDGRLGSELAQALERVGQEVFRVEPGSAFRRLGPASWVLSPDRPEEYRRLLRQLAEAGQSPQVIVHLWSLTAEGEQLTRSLELGCASLLYLVQALERECAGQGVRIEVVSNGLHAVTEAETALPEKAALAAFCKVAPQEYPNLRCRTVDVRVPPPGRRRTWLAELLRTELASPSSELAVAYRGAERWTEALEPIRLDPVESPDRGLHPGCVYLITGGLAGTSLAIAELLAGVGARLAIVEATSFPAEETWEAWRSDGGGEEVSRSIGKIDKLRRLGAEVLVAGVDTEDPDQLRAFITRAEETFGRLDGVIHSPARPADTPTFFPIGELDAGRLEAFLRPVVAATQALAAALLDRDLDVCLLLASNASLLGGLGALPTAVISSFLDAFARKRAGVEPVLWMSANWDYWSEEQRRESKLTGGVGQYDMSVMEGREVLRRLVAPNGHSRVAVSPVDLAARLRTWVEPEAAATGGGVHHPRPELKSTFTAPRDGMEGEIAALWQELLGIERIGVFDDFFELGGHSLLATRLVSRLRAAFQVEVPLRRLFEAPTVADCAAMILDMQVKKVSREELERLLGEIKQLDDESLQTVLLAERKSLKKGEGNG